jgi:hypothetical protein
VPIVILVLLQQLLLLLDDGRALGRGLLAGHGERDCAEECVGLDATVGERDGESRIEGKDKPK